MATHSNILAWRIPWTEEPGRFQSTWLQRVIHDWSDLAHTINVVICLHEWEELKSHVLPVADVCGGPTRWEMEEIWDGNGSSPPFKIEKLGHRDVIQLLNHHTQSSRIGHLGPIKVPSAFYWGASPWPRSAQMPFSPWSPVTGQESGPSLEVAIKVSLEPWGGVSKGSCLAGWGRGLRPISAALGSWQQVWMMNGQLNTMEQIDHCITDHNLFISSKRAIHYPGCHTAHVIARDKSPKPHSLGFSSHLFST